VAVAPTREQAIGRIDDAQLVWGDASLADQSCREMHPVDTTADD
jgi:hypothetical protein